jgi:hypothetical protein
MCASVQTFRAQSFQIAACARKGLMVENNPEVRKERLAELMERAQAAFERSRHLVQESRKIRAEAEARRSAYSEQSQEGRFAGAALQGQRAADQAAG